MQTINNEIILAGLFFKKSILTSSIKAYHVTKKAAEGGPYLGILLILDDKKFIQLDERNIKLVTDFINYLDKNNVPYLGERRPKFPFNQ